MASSVGVGDLCVDLHNNIVRTEIHLKYTLETRDSDTRPGVGKEGETGRDIFLPMLEANARREAIRESSRERV
eukprot:1341050-Amorphochlora_amoeboformis.AAC.1